MSLSWTRGESCREFWRTVGRAAVLFSQRTWARRTRVPTSGLFDERLLRVQTVCRKRAKPRVGCGRTCAESCRRCRAAHGFADAALCRRLRSARLRRGQVRRNRVVDDGGGFGARRAVFGTADFDE